MIRWCRRRPRGVYRGADDYAAIQAIEQAGVPLVLSVYLDRPAILTEVAPAAGCCWPTSAPWIRPCSMS